MMSFSRRLLARRASFVSVALSVLTLQACGSSPSGPSEAPVGTPLHLKAGTQYLSFFGFNVSPYPEYPPCTPLFQPAAGTEIVTLVTLEQSGSEWVARSSFPEAGTLELRLHGTGLQIAGDGVSGSVRGRGIDQGSPLRGRRDVNVTLSGANGVSTLSGTASRGAYLVDGRTAGVITFSDSMGLEAHCTAVQWMMQPTSGVLDGPLSLLVRPR
jgi:hypothetical protein